LGPPAVVVAAVDIDVAGHLTIPLRIAERADWLDKVNSRQDVLAVLPKSGIVELLSWAPHGEAVIEKKRELEGRLKDDPMALAALSQLSIRYRRLAITKGLETILGADIRLHLGIQAPTAARVYVMAVDGKIQLLAKDIVESRLTEQHDELSALP